MSAPELRLRADYMRDRRVSRLAEGPCFADAIALHLDACSQSAREAQDGTVTRGEAIRMGWHRAAASELVRVGLWGQLDDGFAIVDWPELCPSAAAGPMAARESDLSVTTAATTLAPGARRSKSRNDSMSLDELFAEADVKSSPKEAMACNSVQSRATVDARSRLVALHESQTVTGTQPQNNASLDAIRPVNTKKRIGDEAGTELALEDLNLKKEINSSTTPPPSSAHRSIDFVAAQTKNIEARVAVGGRRRPAARRRVRANDLLLPFDADGPIPKHQSKAQADESSAARGARLIFEATNIDHSSSSFRHKKSFEWLASRPAAEWEIAKPVLLREAANPRVRSMLTPRHIADYWPTHYSLGKAPRPREELEHERAALKPVRGFVGLPPLPTDAEYAAEYAAAQAGTWRVQC